MRNALLALYFASNTIPFQGLRIARELEIPTVLKTSPAADISVDALKQANYIMLNEHEAPFFLGHKGTTLKNMRACYAVGAADVKWAGQQKKTKINRWFSTHFSS